MTNLEPRTPILYEKEHICQAIIAIKDVDCNGKVVNEQKIIDSKYLFFRVI